jgi:filamentous hemagglutinin family protein
MNRHGSINRHYRLVWNSALSTWIPIAENAPNHRRGRGAARSVAATLVLVVPLAQASPGGGKVVSGTGSISQAGNSTDIHQSSQTLSIDWQSFNVSAQQSVDFFQPSASAVAVNRIIDANGSQILGRLTANGQVFLINPNGIVFGKGAQVNVGGLVASTLDLNDASLAGSSRSFSGNAAAGSVVNLGTITASNGGYAALVGNQVSNQGVITAQLGTVALGAGSALTLTFSGSSLVHVQVDRSVLKSVADNGGLLQADGGSVVMTAGAKDALLASVVNNTGVVEARTVASHDGTISLLGDPGEGAVNVAGTLDASAPDGGNGGRIETSAARVEVADAARVTTASHGGLYGSWLVDSQDFAVARSGGDISGATLSAELANTSVTVRSSGGTKSRHGDVNVNDSVSWSSNTALDLIAANNVDVNLKVSLTATGANAGITIDPNTADGSAPASGTGWFHLGTYATINLPNVSPTSTTALVIGGTSYTVINRLGLQGSTTGTDLQGINGHLSGRFALGSNIDASATSGWNAGAGFTPIGISGAAFTGTIDGLGHSVGNLTINRPTTGDLGLFGFTGTSSVIRNLGVTGGSVTGAINVGALAGQNYGGAINASYATGKVTGAADVGGLVGANLAGFDSTGSNFVVGSISYSHATGTVSGTGNYVGGLVGYNQGPVSTSFATGSVRGANYVGGLVGFIEGNYEAAGSVFNSHATGSVKGATDVGGLVGAVGGGYGGSIDKGWASGSVTGTSNVGGLLGYNGGGTIFYGVSAGTTGTVTRSHATGNVSGSGANVGGLVGLNGGGIYGSYATGAVAGGNEVGGLVGLNGGWNGTYRGGEYAKGGITGSFATGSVKGATDVGGLVGFNGGGNGSYGDIGIVNDSYASGMVTGSSHVGGLVGNNSYGTLVNNSYAKGYVRGSSEVGGLVGLNSGPGGNYGLVGGISKTYSTGKVAGTSNVGGLVGSNGGTVDDSFWDVMTSGQAASAGGRGMTTAQMQQQANFTSATAANGNANPGWDFTSTWFMYDGHTYPLLASFMRPLTVTANSGSVTYTGSAYQGANGVTYSIAPAGHLYGALSFSSTPQPAINVGTYIITPGGLYSDQRGYIIRYGSGTLIINP